MMTDTERIELWRRIHERAERLSYVLMAPAVYGWDIGLEVAREARTLAREVRRYRQAGGVL
ncbi:MAG TPA: hypothetical protein VGK73_32270 [Polyangiaceae bacterium]